VAAPQTRGKRHRTEAHADEATDRVSHCLEEPSHDAAPTLAQYHAIPSVRPGTTRALQGLETTLAVFEFDSVLQACSLFLSDLSVRAHGVLPFERETGMSEAVGKVTRRGEEEQPTGIEIQPADVQPPPGSRRRQVVKHAGASLRIVSTHDLALGLVVDQHSRQRGAPLTKLPPVETHPIAGSNAGPEHGRCAVDGQAACPDKVLHFATRTEPNRREDLL
jgi:hypothetical protein